ncbi:hypothetical protein [Phenylobacterium sp.]|jgi:hypothetical protein|uniref:hypothetical protein n=1 Tax=Phenylobacterium sp. TaxID=1871053 RepID=UPI0037C589B2
MMIVCGLALCRGQDDERLAAAATLANWAITLVLSRPLSEETQWAVMAVDSVLLVLMVCLALRSNRYWPLFSAGFTLLIVVTHIAHALDTGVNGWAYLTAMLIWSYLSLLTIGYGAWTAPYVRAAGVTADATPGATLR